MPHLVPNTTQIYPPRLDESHQRPSIMFQSKPLSWNHLKIFCIGDHEFEVSTATRYLYETVRDALSDQAAAAAARLYVIFIIPGLAQATFWMMVYMIHSARGKSSKLSGSEIYTLEETWSANECWVSSSRLPGTLHYRYAAAAWWQQARRSSICLQVSSDERMLQPPPSCSVETFIYDAATNTATILQATVSKIISGIEWLQGLRSS